MKHVIVYQEEGRYAGWPANYGIWSWGDEIVVGFTSGYHLDDGGFHARDQSRPFTPIQARSLDGGLTWECVEMAVRVPGNKGLSTGEHVKVEIEGADLVNAPVQLEEGIDFKHPGFAMMFAREDLGRGSSWFYTSSDRCRAWQGPHKLSMMGQVGIAARTAYLVTDSQNAMIFLTAPTVEGTETGSRVFCAQSTDGGRNFSFKSWVSPIREAGFSIMPASVRLSDKELLVATRERQTFENKGGHDWIDLYYSDDNGLTWQYRSRPVKDSGKGGNPGTLNRLSDGRICMTYAFRNAPFGMRARISEDEGLTWSEEVVLRNDGGSHDIGYPRTTLRSDGSLVTVYYYNDRLGGACYIAATIWRP